jgi:hypothetical protein
LCLNNKAATTCKKSKTIWEEQHILKDRYCFIQLCNCYVCSYQHLPEQKSNDTTTTGGQNSRDSWPVSSVQYYNLAKIEIFIDKQCHLRRGSNRKIWFNPPFLWKCLYQVRAIAVFPVFLLLNDFVCLLTYEFCLSLWKIARCSLILLLPLLYK